VPLLVPVDVVVAGRSTSTDFRRSTTAWTVDDRSAPYERVLPAASTVGRTV
jgi:hypothetical protein